MAKPVAWTYVWKGKVFSFKERQGLREGKACSVVDRRSTVVESVSTLGTKVSAAIGKPVDCY